MKTSLRLMLIVTVLAAGLAFAPNTPAQNNQQTIKKVNSPFAQNPKTKNKTASSEIKPEIVTSTENKVSGNQETNNINLTAGDKEFESRSVASKTLEVVKRANKNAVSPTEIYKIGVGDVLFISLQNAPAKASTYFTVLNDGTIDYPLAGEMVMVSGLTTEEVEDLMKEKIKLFENPQVSVKVREHASHAITVLGLVEKAGETYIRREAVPLFMIRAEVIVQPKANLLVIKRANAETEQVDLKDPKSDDILIFPGDILEFKASEDYDSNSFGKQFYLRQYRFIRSEGFSSRFDFDAGDSCFGRAEKIER
jgi:protein involved in polysaccharide export with SLBB domain